MIEGAGRGPQAPPLAAGTGTPAAASGAAPPYTFRWSGQPDDLTEEVFGWNPFSGGGRDPSKVQPLPEWAAANHEIMELTDLYQQQLAELVAAHSLLTQDQESFAAMLCPYINKDDGSFIRAPDENVLLMKRGLDLRLLEFEEDCRRIQQTERRLQRKIDDCTLTYETSLIQARGYAETRLLEQIQQQQKVIECQQHELDELRFQRDLYSDETLRLRQLCRFGHFRSPDPRGAWKAVDRAPLPSPRTLHKEYSAARPPFSWMRNIRHSRHRRRDLEEKRLISASNEDKQHPTSTAGRSALRGLNRRSASTAPPDQPFASASLARSGTRRRNDREIVSADPKVLSVVAPKEPEAPKSSILGALGQMFASPAPETAQELEKASDPAKVERSPTAAPRSAPKTRVGMFNSLSSASSEMSEKEMVPKLRPVGRPPPPPPPKKAPVRGTAHPPEAPAIHGLLPSARDSSESLIKSAPPTITEPSAIQAKIGVDRRPSGLGLAIGTRRLSRRSSSRLSSGMPSPHRSGESLLSRRSSSSPTGRVTRTIPSPRPTTISRLSSPAIPGAGRQLSSAQPSYESIADFL